MSSTEAAIALRQRLNETVDQLDALRKEHAELEVKCESMTKELTIARSDCQLRLVICHSLTLILFFVSKLGQQGPA